MKKYLDNADHRMVETPNGKRKVVNLKDVFVGIGVLEAELRGGRIHVEMNNGRFWQVRRNGATKTWKRDPNRFAIPVKYGLRGYETIRDHDLHTFWVAID